MDRVTWGDNYHSFHDSRVEPLTNILNSFIIDKRHTWVFGGKTREMLDLPGYVWTEESPDGSPHDWQLWVDGKGPFQRLKDQRRTVVARTNIDCDHSGWERVYDYVSGPSLEWGWKCCAVWRVALESKEARAWCSYCTDKRRPGSTPIQCLRNLPVHAWRAAYLSCLFIYFLPHILWDLSSPTPGRTCAPCTESRVLTTGPPGKSIISPLLDGQLGQSRWPG